MFAVINSTNELSGAATDTTILSVGAMVQCGPHLRLHLDTLVAGYYAQAWGEAPSAYVLPTMPCNTIEEHVSLMMRSRLTLHGHDGVRGDRRGPAGPGGPQADPHGRPRRIAAVTGAFLNLWPPGP